MNLAQGIAGRHALVESTRAERIVVSQVSAVMFPVSYIDSAHMKKQHVGVTHLHEGFVGTASVARPYWFDVVVSGQRTILRCVVGAQGGVVFLGLGFIGGVCPAGVGTLSDAFRADDLAGFGFGDLDRAAV